jgi:hypothetical protein
MTDRRRPIPWLAAAGLGLALLAGCTTSGSSPGLWELWRERLHGHFRGHWPEKVERIKPAGLRVPIPRPYLLVKAGAGGGLDFQVVYLPDASEEMWIEPQGSRAAFKISLDDAGFLRELSGRFKSDRVQIGGAAEPQPAGPLRFSDLGRTGGLQPGLYRIVTADPQGGPVPRLEPVQIQPAGSPEALRIDAIRFRTCPARPEIVQRIEITADRGALEPLLSLARQVQVFRGDAPVESRGFDVQGRAISLTVDPECARGFSPYSVALPAQDLAPGSVLEAGFPTAGKLADLRPRATIHLIQDDQKRPRYLVVELAAGGGSPVAPLTDLDRPASLLLINGKVTRNARVASGTAGAGAQLIDLGEEEVRSLFFSLVPRNAAGLTGQPASFTWTASEPRREEPKKPAAVAVQETSLETGAAGRTLSLVLSDPAHRMDLETTMARNRGQRWSGVRCQPREGTELACSGSTTATGKIRFDIYCLGEDEPCTTVSFTD